MLTEFIENTVPDFPDVTANLIQYRGQADFSWKLVPSLTRIVSGDEISMKTALGYESQATLDFMAQIHLLDNKLSFDKSDDRSSLFVDMQHYSCPTRLLDWTQSPYVALYFAVNDNFGSNGALFVWDYRFYQRNYKVVNPDEEEIKGIDILNYKKRDIIELVFATKLNERIVRQQGCFSVSNNIKKAHDDLIIEAARKAAKPSGLYKLEIPSDLKLEFLARLKVMNITPESLFPGLDGLGRTIKEALLLRRWKKV